jgi:putative sterol carrier protein
VSIIGIGEIIKADRNSKHGRSSMRSFLENQFCSEKAGELDARVRIQWADGQICFQIRGGAISFDKDDDPELTIYFKDSEDAMGLIKGQRDPVNAFMHGNLRSNGHLIWVFQTMAALSGKTDAAIP